MDHKLCVLVQVDAHGAQVRLLVTGCVPEANQHSLHPVVAAARRLMPRVAVTVDLTVAEHVEVAAVDLLRWAIEAGEAGSGTGPVEVLPPIDAPAHRPVTVLRGRARNLTMSPVRWSA
ncbi:hypothetical protein GCM10009696_00110 [Kocuria himachalensis]